MDRTEVLELMSTLKLFGMRAAYDEVMATGINRRHKPPRIVGAETSAPVGCRWLMSNRCGVRWAGRRGLSIGERPCDLRQ